MHKIKVEILDSTSPKVLKRALEKPYGAEMRQSSWKSVAKRVILGQKHESVVEHINFNFDLDGYSRMILQETARHRLQSKTVASTRFTLTKIVKAVDVEDFCVIPTNMLKTEDQSDFKYDMQAVYDLQKHLILKWKDLGYKNDVLKYFLSEATRTTEVATFNVRSLYNLFRLRLVKTKDNNPHPEFMYLTNLMLDEINKTEWAWLFDHIEEERK